MRARKHEHVRRLGRGGGGRGSGHRGQRPLRTAARNCFAPVASWVHVVLAIAAYTVHPLLSALLAASRVYDYRIIVQPRNVLRSQCPLLSQRRPTVAICASVASTRIGRAIL